MPLLADVSDDTFAEEVLRSTLPVLVDFWAEWCGPCRRMHPILEELAHEMSGRLRIVRLDVAANPRVPTQEGVLTLPTLILYCDGQPLERFGSLSKDRLCHKLEKWI